jgi:hypothetical protein
MPHRRRWREPRLPTPTLPSKVTPIDPQIRPQLAALSVADPPERWRALGFAVEGDGRCDLGGVQLQLGADGYGITTWSIRGIAESITDIDGLPTTPAPETPDAPAKPRPTRAEHPNTATALDHVVIVTPDFDRTTAALATAGIPLRRVRQVGHVDAANSFRQGFRRLGPAIMEVVEAKGGEPGPARFWGLVVIVSDLDALKDMLGDRLTTPKPAVQRGRRIATLDRSAGLTPQVAFMTPEP